jgi:hypothetical protein
VTCPWLSLVSSTNKTDCHDITEILLKVALNTIKQTNKQKNKTVLTVTSHWKIQHLLFCQIIRQFSPFFDLLIVLIPIGGNLENVSLKWQKKIGKFSANCFILLEQFCVCPKPGPRFQRHMSWCFFVFSEKVRGERWEVIVRFANISGIVDHYCLNIKMIKFTNKMIKFTIKMIKFTIKMIKKSFQSG